MNDVKINIRPHYTFAYYLESMMVGNESLLFYRKKDHSLHYQYKASLLDCIQGEKDGEYIIPISEEFAYQLEKVFGLMIDAYCIYTSNGEKWCVLDGSECVLICGKKRVRFNVDSLDEPLDAFCKMANKLSDIKVLKDEVKLKQIFRSLPKIAATLETYISSFSLTVV